MECERSLVPGFDGGGAQPECLAIEHLVIRAVFGALVATPARQHVEQHARFPRNGKGNVLEAADL
ncbi:hypothetical protein LMG27952_01024 [Paraburkholderia hiiakae]|uniref:Uncharacterized protein n=1 Tax=Paraburkholderia hiiakae TaxID=1081782 RepID=A0ABM8NDN4_9BURK|nr:hypothetical protein LMG27952_01024 [Paraburkholderia hiiakae]